MQTADKLNRAVSTWKETTVIPPYANIVATSLGDNYIGIGGEGFGFGRFVLLKTLLQNCI